MRLRAASGAKSLLGLAVRLRYLVLLVVCAGVADWTWSHRRSGLSDWLYFEFGARTIAHMGGVYSSGLHLYAQHPGVQIGPPPLAAIAALQWLSPAVVAEIFVGLMALCGLLVVWCAEGIARTFVDIDRDQLARATLGAGIVVIALWSREAAKWQHLDDVMAITACAVALRLVVRQRHWWQAGMLVGLAMASKPWAIILAPMLLGLPRVRRARAAVVAIASAAACWAPFVIADRGTISALGGMRLIVSSTSSLVALGVHASSYAPIWVRPVQMVGGFLLMWWLARSGRAAAVPFLGLLFRVVTDPQTWGYYGVGPVVGALLWEAGRGRRMPVMTIAVAAVEFAAPLVVPSATPWLRLGLVAGCAVDVWRSAPDRTAQPLSSTAGRTRAVLAQSCQARLMPSG